MEKENEYREGGRLHVREIKGCKCTQKAGGRYGLRCRIHQRGEAVYDYCPEEGCLKRNGKCLWPEPAAAETVGAAIRRFETEREQLEREGHRLALVGQAFVLYYRHAAAEEYEYLLQLKDAEGCVCRIAGQSRNAGDMARDICWQARLNGYGGNPIIGIIDRSTEQNAGGNPLYRHALDTGDEVMAKQLKLTYHIETAEDCRWLGEHFGTRILPPLGGEYDREYTVDADTADLELLKGSGYVILHRPYYAMPGRTHGKWTLNPHTKTGTDAAKTDEEAIPFRDFLALFENDGPEPE